MRYTERHGGVAVIKDKSKHKDAMEKLAKVEDLEEKNTDMDKITTEMMEYICDNQCKHPYNAEDQQELDDICAECKMGKFLCDILNTYNHRMQQLSEVKESSLDPIEMCEVKMLIGEFLEYKRLEEQGLLLKLLYPLETDEVFIADENTRDVYCLDAREFSPFKMDSDSEIIYRIDNNDFKASDFGRILFLTEKEAQAALEKMKNR